MKKQIQLIFAASLLASGLSSCKDDKPEIPPPAAEVQAEVEQLTPELLDGVDSALAEDAPQELKQKAKTFKEEMAEMAGNLSELGKLKSQEGYEALKEKAAAIKKSSVEAWQKTKDQTSDATHKAIDSSNRKLQDYNEKLKKAIAEAKKSEASTEQKEDKSVPAE